MKSLFSASRISIFPLSAVALLIAAGTWAQERPAGAPPGGERPGPPPRPSDGPGGPGHGAPGGERRFQRPGGGMSGSFQSEGFERLPEAEKARVRAAMDKAWTSPELREARDRYMKANEEFRAAMRKALEQVDPGVVAILEKIKPRDGAFDSRNWPKLPPPEDAGFVSAAVHRLEMEVVNFARPESRDRLRAIHGRVMQSPLVVEALKKLTDAPPGERMEMLRQLRETYRMAIVKELPPRGGSEPETRSTAPTPPIPARE